MLLMAYDETRDGRNNYRFRTPGMCIFIANWRL